MSLKPVQPGEPIRPALTAEWYNHTIKPHPTPKPSPRKQGRERHGEDFSTFVPTSECSIAYRFTAVAPINRIGEGYDDYTQRNFHVNKEGLDKYNWAVCQQDMKAGALTQKVVYAGPTFAKVTVTDPEHRFVDLNLDTLELE